MQAATASFPLVTLCDVDVEADVDADVVVVIGTGSRLDWSSSNRPVK